MGEFLTTYWPAILFAITATITVVAAGHVLIYKRDARAAIAWVGLIMLSPILGTLLYLLLGINRIHRRARNLRGDSTSPKQRSGAGHIQEIDTLPVTPSLRPLAAVNNRVSSRPILQGNSIRPLINGDETYPAMLMALEKAQKSISLCTYIFNNDPLGRQIVKALAKALKRGVMVRVLVDAAGSRYSRPTIVPALQAAEIPFALFLPTFANIKSINLRNHRKILIVDGQYGFTGGINLQQPHVIDRAFGYKVPDLHFAVSGPVLAQLQETFAEDWEFATGEQLSGPDWFPMLAPTGQIPARAVVDGPDENMHRFLWTLSAALQAARSHVVIMTPYFLPGRVLIHELGMAAMRGVQVDIILPKRVNWKMVSWASHALMWQVLEHGCRVFKTPGHFTHSKLMVVDDQWVLLGSANWDSRSLRLNFELNVECYSAELANALAPYIASRMTDAEPLTLTDVNQRSLLVKLRDGFAHLFTPFL